MRAMVLSLCGVLLAACASEPQLPWLPAAARATLTVSEVRWPAQGLQAGLEANQTESGASGFFKGLGQGALLGVNPYSWLLGGPLFLGPLGAYLTAKCGKALGQVHDPVARFQRVAQQVGLSAVKASLDEGRSGPNDASGDRYVLVVDEVRLELGSAFESQGADCTPALHVGAAWHLVQQSDGRTLRAQTTICSGPTHHASFVALFDDEAKLAELMAAALQRLGREVVAALRAPEPRKCKL